MTRNPNYAQEGENYRLEGMNFPISNDPNSSDPNSTTWLAQNASDIALRNFQKAKEAFDKAIAANSENAWTYAHRGATYRMLGWMASSITEKEKNYSLAARDFETAIKLNPKYAWAYAHQGENYCSWGVDFIGVEDKKSEAEKLLESAIEAFQKAIEINSEYAWSYAHKGVAHRFLGGFFRGECKSKEQSNFEQAVQDLEKATKLNCKYAWAYANLGTVHREKALTYGWLQQKNPDDNLLQEERDEWKSAFMNVQAAIEISPEIFTKSTLRKNSIIFTGEVPTDLTQNSGSVPFSETSSRGIDEEKTRANIQYKYVLYAKAVNKVYAEGLQAAQEDIKAALEALRSV